MPRRTTLLVTLALLPAAGVGTWLLHRRAPANPLRLLAEAHVPRAFPARLSIVVEYRACTARPAKGDESIPREECGASETAGLDPNRLLAPGESTDPDSLQASALAQAIWAETATERLDDAVSRLEKALRLSRSPVPLLVDLSGVHLVRAERTQNPLDLLRALDYSREALEQDPGNLAALFNAALALQALPLDGEAARAWERYLAADSTSSWAVEARRRRSDVPRSAPLLRAPRPGASAAEAEAFAKLHPQDARLLGWEHVLDDWGAAVIGGDAAGAASNLELAGRLGLALERRGGDRSLADAVRAIRAAAADPSAIGLLARGHREYAAGTAHAAATDDKAARDAFGRVVRSRAHSAVLLQWAAAERITALGYIDPATADAASDSLLRQVDTVRHPALAARLNWLSGTRRLRQGAFPEALAHYTAAGGTFRRIGEREFGGAVLGWAGEVAHGQGDTVAAYRHIHRALESFRRRRGSMQLHNLLVTLAHYAQADGMSRAAERINDEDVRSSVGADAVTRVEALLARAELLATTGQIDRAKRDVAAAVPLMKPLPQLTRDQFKADLQLTRALIASAGDTGALAAIDSATGSREANVVWLLPMLMHRADLRLANGDIAGAVQDLDDVTARIRALSERERSSWLRAAMVEKARSRFDQLVMLHVNARRSGEALKALEQGRVSFAAGTNVRAAARREPAAPPGQVAVEYTLIGDTLLIWTIRGGDVALTKQTVRREEFLLTVERVGAALQTAARSARVQPELARMYDWLVRPVAKRLGARETPLVILADGEIAGVPFAALLDSTTGRYLVEDHSLRFAATLADASRAASLRTEPEAALLVADPAFDRAQYPGLPPLKGARAEVDSLQQVYRDAQVLTGTDATRAALAADVPRATVIHYAGHAVFDDAQPERSFLVLAGNGTSGRLSADSMSTMKLGHVRLVTLSACRTLRSRSGRSGGFSGLAGALLKAGAGGVVGSVADVPDRLVQPLMLAFHREYLATGNAAEALRQAQLQQLRLHRSPGVWAAFRYAGQ